jgi:hypothetical protein
VERQARQSLLLKASFNRKKGLPTARHGRRAYLNKESLCFNFLAIFSYWSAEDDFAENDKYPERRVLIMFGMTDSADNVAHIIQIALTPVFLLSGIASLLGVFSTRLARVADRVDDVAEKFETATELERKRLENRLVYLRKRSHLLDAAVMLGTLGGAATCLAALLLFVGTLRDQTGVSLFIAFGFALIFTMGALAAFLAEMLLASRGIRDHIAKADEAEAEADAEPPEPDDNSLNDETSALSQS